MMFADHLAFTHIYVRLCSQVRLFLRRGLSVRYLLPTAVVDYIEQHGLYQDDGPNANPTTILADHGKGKEPSSAKHCSLHPQTIS